MPQTSKRIIWLASWYPSKLNPYNGDFIQRHAKACSIFCTIYLIHIIKDEKGFFTKDVLVEKSVNGQLTELVIYYYGPRKWISIADKFLSDRKYRRLIKMAIKRYIDNEGIPDLIHVHTGMKAGVAATWANKNFSIPYIVTEHWTGFLSEASEKFSRLPAYYQAIWKNVLKQAKAVSVVSEYLKRNIQRIISETKIEVVPNVVNTSIFKKDNDHHNNSIVFLHVSNLQHYKNSRDIIIAYSLIVNRYPNSRLKIIGGTDDELSRDISKLGLSDHVIFFPEIPQAELADHMAKSTALILYSHYETFGCVIIEANACGVPVIVSDIPVFHETVTNNVNGIFAKSSDPASLANAMVEIIKKRSFFNSDAIAKMTAEKYSYEVVGKQFDELYKKILKG